MLSFLKSKDGIRYNPEISIEIAEGPNFFDIIANLFLNELKEIYRIGLLKRYVPKSDNLNYLKGKLLLKNHLNNEINRNPKFYCGYNDLTFNNLEN
ncbi:MAG: hypothetical protein NTZ75_09195 [Euryarchaeota archaeon]|nr:hypothetical protein [Euryarchaeota archaeon]